MREFLTLRDLRSVCMWVWWAMMWRWHAIFGPFPRVEPSASSKVPRHDTLDAKGAGWVWLNGDAGLVLQGLKKFKHLGIFFFFYVVEGGFYFFYFH